MDTIIKNQRFSRWASDTEIKSSLYEIKLDNNKTPEYGGIPLYAEQDSVYVEKLDSHSLVFGSTGSKKTRLLGMPSLRLYAMAGESFIATDPKAELYERTLPLLKENGYKIFVLNLRNPKESNGWNPLLIPYALYHNNQRDKAIELVNDMAGCIVKEEFVKEPYWQNNASDLLAGLILILFECAKESEVNLKSLRALRNQAFRITNNRNSDNSIPFIREHFLNFLNPSSFVCSLLSGTAEVCDVTRGCIISEFDQALRVFFSQDNLINMLSDNDLDMSRIGKEKTAVFLIIPDENTLYHRLVSVFIKQCYTELIIEAQKQIKKTLPLRVNYLLDEFASLPAIRDFPSMITASRSRNIRFNLIVQSFNQLKRRYGEEAETIKGNCENWIFLHSRERFLLEELSVLSGMKNSDEALVSIQLLQTLDKDKGEAFIFHKRKHPFLTKLLDIDSYPAMMSNGTEVKYPENNNKAQDVFDFEKFCRKKDGYFLSQLFSGKTHDEIINDHAAEEKYYLPDVENIVEPIFRSIIPESKTINSENEKSKETINLTTKKAKKKKRKVIKHINKKKISAKGDD